MKNKHVPKGILRQHEANIQRCIESHYINNTEKLMYKELLRDLKDREAKIDRMKYEKRYSYMLIVKNDYERIFSLLSHTISNRREN